MKVEIEQSQLLKYVCFRFINIYQLMMVREVSDWLDFGSRLITKMYHNIIIHINNFSFGYIAVSCLFETFPTTQSLPEKFQNSDFNENLVISLDLDLDFELRLRVCQNWFYFWFNCILENSTSLFPVFKEFSQISLSYFARFIFHFI